MIRSALAHVYSYIGRMLGRNSPEATKPAAQEGRSYGEPEVADAGDNTEIRVYDYIVDQMEADWFGIGVSDAGFLKALAKAKAAGKPIVVRINSGGGNVFTGLTIASHVADNKLPVVVDGVAASIASVIAARASHLTMKLGSTLMLHNPWSMAAGNAKAFRAEADVLDTIRDSMVDIYLARTGNHMTRKEWEDVLDGQDGADGTWWTGEQAMAHGFADVYEQPHPMDAAARAQLLEQRKNVAAVMGVTLPKILETEVAPGAAAAKEPAPSGNPQSAALGGQGQKDIQPSVRVSHRPGAFYLGK